MAKSSRTTVGSPLEPGLLGELGALKTLPAADGFRADGSWIHTYRIWTCHGYVESGNDNVGYLQIERKVGGRGDDFVLTVRQVVLEQDGQVSEIDARVRCRADGIGTPVEWRLSSSFTGPGGKVQEELSTEETGSIEGGEMVVDRGGGKIKRAMPPAVTGDWCLFEAVQRIGFGADSLPRFHLLEGLGVLKGPQSLSYRGGESVEIGGDEVKLHRFDQIGHGVLPTEYWVDANHRLVVAASLNKAYVLDGGARERLEGKIKDSRKAYRAKRQG